MANVLNRTSLVYLESVNTPEYDPSEWIINPDLSSVSDIPVSYWKIVGDTVEAMSEEEREDFERVAPYRGLDLDGAKTVKKTMVNEFRDQHMDGGWTYKGVWYDSDAMARQNMAGTMTLIVSGYILPNTFTWRARDNTNQPFDNTSFADFYRASCLWMEMIYHASWWHKAEIDALEDISEIIAYDITTNWPEGMP